jgi:hypothetical protein
MQLCQMDSRATNLQSVNYFLSSLWSACCVIAYNWYIRRNSLLCNEYYVFSFCSRKVQNPDNGTESLFDMWMASDSSLVSTLCLGKDRHTVRSLSILSAWHAKVNIMNSLDMVLFHMS